MDSATGALSLVLRSWKIANLTETGGGAGRCAYSAQSVLSAGYEKDQQKSVKLGKCIAAVFLVWLVGGMEIFASLFLTSLAQRFALIVGGLRLTVGNCVARHRMGVSQYPVDLAIVPLVGPIQARLQRMRQRFERLMARRTVYR